MEAKLAIPALVSRLDHSQVTDHCTLQIVNVIFAISNRCEVILFLSID